jgi:hypothetical protein
MDRIVNGLQLIEEGGGYFHPKIKDKLIKSILVRETSFQGETSDNKTWDIITSVEKSKGEHLVPLPVRTSSLNFVVNQISRLEVQ